MRSIKEWFYSTVTTDEAIISLLGITDSDKRVYEAWPSEELTGTYMVYRFVGGLSDLYSANEATRPDVQFIVDVFSSSSSTCDSVYDAMDSLFQYSTCITPTGWRILLTTVGNQNDLPEFDEKGKIKIYHKNFNIQCNGVFKDA